MIYFLWKLLVFCPLIRNFADAMIRQKEKYRQFKEWQHQPHQVAPLSPSWTYLFFSVKCDFVSLSAIAHISPYLHFCFVAAAAKSLQSCPTLCQPRDDSPPGFPVPGILQARTLECAHITFLSCTAHVAPHGMIT